MGASAAAGGPGDAERAAARGDQRPAARRPEAPPGAGLIVVLEDAILRGPMPVRPAAL